MVKTLKDNLTRAVAEKCPLEIDLERQAVEHSASKHYQGQVVRAKLTKMSNEAVKMGA